MRAPLAARSVLTMAAMLAESAKHFVLEATRADAITRCESLQSLWSGYGDIQRMTLDGAEAPLSVIVKRIAPPARRARGEAAADDTSLRRKVRSYQIEACWYRDWSERCPESARVPHCFGVGGTDRERLIVLEDLDAAGFPRRTSRINKGEVQTCLRWLAQFHGAFLGVAPTGLWKTGTYWHLRTRPDEYARMADGPLKRAAQALDDALNRCRYQTVVHGDAKVENFCFSHNGQRVAAVDFQYVGGGCGIKDVAYLLDSALSVRECSAWEHELLACYFDELHNALHARNVRVDFAELKDEWTRLYAIAWADFARFFAGWSPDQAALSGYSRGLIERALAQVRLTPATDSRL